MSIDKLDKLFANLNINENGPSIAYDEKNNPITFTNIQGTQEDRLSISWIDIYCKELEVKKEGLKCGNYECIEDYNIIHGAHIHLYDDEEYIIPLCPKHNNPKNRELMLLRNGIKAMEITGRIREKYTPAPEKEEPPDLTESEDDTEADPDWTP